MTENSEQWRQRDTVPMWLFNYVINPLATIVLRSPFHSFVSGFLVLFTFTGRKSGKQYTIPVAYDEKDDDLRILTDSAWWVNMAEGMKVIVRLKGKKREGTVHTLVTDRKAVGQAILEDIQKRGRGYARGQFRLELDPGKDVMLEDVMPVIGQRKLFHVTLSDK